MHPKSLPRPLDPDSHYTLTAHFIPMRSHL